jgi:hypothetical protein
MSDLLKMVATANRFEKFAQEDPDCPDDLKRHIGSLVCIYWSKHQQSQQSEKIH